jgi:hypothetical protein
MAITPNEATQRLNTLGLIDLTKVAQATRVKIIRSQVDYEKIMTLMQNDIQEGLKKIKPEGFDEQLQKFAPIVNPSEETADQVEGLKADKEYKKFQETYDKVQGEYSELYTKIATENTYASNAPEFTEDDLLEIATALPAGEETELKDGNKVANHDILKAVVAVLFA